MTQSAPSLPPRPHQLTCVAIDGRAVLLSGPSGSGKTSLALELIDRGAILVGDDSVLLEARESRLLARPHPNTRGLVEVRNLGILHEPCCDLAPVALIVTLDHDAPRFIEGPDTIVIDGIAVPHLRIWPQSAPMAIKIERALAAYGLPG